MLGGSVCTCHRWYNTAGVAEVEGEVAEEVAEEASSRRRKVVRLREERSSQPRN